MVRGIRIVSVYSVTVAQYFLNFIILGDVNILYLTNMFLYTFGFI